MRTFDFHPEIPIGKRRILALMIWLHIGFFNPMKKRQVGEIIPTFNILPQLGVGIDRRGNGFNLCIGWLNFLLKLHVSSWVSDTFKVRNV